MDDQPLRRVSADRYTDFSLVGKGGMGVVYLALDSELNRHVAFKMVLPDPAADRDAPAPRAPLECTPPQPSQLGSSESFETLRKRFLQEAWVTGAMEHPGIVPVYELGETGEGIPYYTMRYVTGERTLKAAIDAAKSFDERLALLEPFLKICDTTRYAHARGVIHRDLKPENIALGSYGEVILLDWGLAKAEGKPDVASGDWQARIEAYRDATDFKTVAGALGTPGFMSPEAALGRTEEVGVRSDVYSLGAILYLILTGRLPFEFENFLEYVNLVIREDPPRADEVDDVVPPELADVCARALRREAAERFERVDELAAALRRWQIEGPIEREVRSLLERALHEIDSGKHLTGNLLLLHLDRATMAVNRVLHLQPEHAEAQSLQLRLKTMRERGIHARVRIERIVVLQRVAAALLTVGAIVALVVFGMLTDEREKTATLQRENRDRLTAAKLEAAKARRQSDVSRGALARALAALSQAALADHSGGAARVLAAAALIRGQDESAWTALANAELSWHPTLRWLFHGADATAVAFDPADAGRLVIGDDAGAVYDIDLKTRPPTVVSHDALRAGITCVTCLEADGQRVIAAGSADGQVALLARDKPGATRTMPASLPRAPAFVEFEDDTLYRGTAVTALHPGPNGGLLVAYDDGRLRLFRDTGELVHVVRHQAKAITALGQMPGQPDQPVYLSASLDGSVIALGGNSLLLTRTWASDANRPVNGFRFDPETDAIQAWSTDGSAWSWELRTGEETVGPPLQFREGSHAQSADSGRVIIMGGPGGAVTAIDRHSGDRLSSGMAQAASIRVLATAPDAPLFVVARDDRTVQVWDLSMESEATPNIAVADPERDRVIQVLPDGRVEVLAEPATEPYEFRHDEGAHIAATAITTAGDQLLTADLGGRVVIWNIDQKRRVWTVKGAGDQLTAIAEAEGENRFLTGSLDGKLRVWYWPTDSYVTFDDATEQPIGLIARAANTNRVAAADTTGAIFLWDSHKRNLLRSWSGSGALRALALSPSAQAMAAIRADAMLVVWNAGQWMERGTLPDKFAILRLSVDDAGRAQWINATGRFGIDTEFEDRPALPTRNAGGSWILVEPNERMANYSAAFGLALDRIGFSLRPIAPNQFDGALRLAR